MIIENGGIRTIATLDTRDARIHSAFGGGLDRIGGLGSVSYRELMRSQPWVYVAVTGIARGLASMPLKAYLRDGNDRKRLRSEDADLARLVAEPYEGGSTFDLIENVVDTYCVDGISLAWLDRHEQGAAPTQIVPLDNEQVQRIYRNERGGRSRLIAYRWQEYGGEEPRYLMPDDVVPFGFANGLSPLRPLATTLQIEDAAQRSVRAFYENGARPSGVFTTDGTLEDGEAERIEAMIKDGHTGVDNRFRVAVLANVPNAKWQAFEATSEAAETLDHRRFNREEVLACYHMPQPQGGVLDRATFSNIETQDRMWIVHTIRVHATMFEQRFAARVLRREPGLAMDGNAFIEFDFGDILRGTPQMRAETYQKLIQGIYTPNELRQLENLPPIADKWADGIYVPANLVPVGTPGPLPKAPTPPAPPADTADALVDLTLGDLATLATNGNGSEYPGS